MKDDESLTFGILTTEGSSRIPNMIRRLLFRKRQDTLQVDLPMTAKVDSEQKIDSTSWMKHWKTTKSNTTNNNSSPQQQGKKKRISRRLSNVPQMIFVSLRRPKSSPSSLSSNKVRDGDAAAQAATANISEFHNSFGCTDRTYGDESSLSFMEGDFDIFEDNKYERRRKQASINKKNTPTLRDILELPNSKQILTTTP